MQLRLDPSDIWIHRLAEGAPTPAWAEEAGWSVVARTPGETTVAGPAPGPDASGPYRVLRVDAVLDHALVGVLVQLLVPLAAAAVPVFVVSSFDTDHVLVPAEHLDTALTALRVAGHRVEADPADRTGTLGAPGASQEWRRVVDERCAGCGLEAARIPVDELALEIGRAAGGWGDLLLRTDESALRLRPTDDVWSPLEYACHVRDVLSLFAQRVVTTLREDEPELGWWDHEAAVSADGYNEQDVRAVADDIVRNAAVLAEVLAGAAGGWDRTATRAAQERFTVAGLVRFALHEAVHHLADARGTTA